MLEKNKNQNDIEIKKQSALPIMAGVFLLLASVIFYVAFLSPMRDEVKALNTAAEENNTEIAGIDEKIAAYKEAEEKLDLSNEVERIQTLKAVPIGMNQDEVIRNFINLTRAYDIEFSSLSFGKGSSSGTGVKTLRINANFEGNYSDLINFLKGIEQNSEGRLFNVNNISVSVKKLAVLGVKRVNFSLNIEAYYQED